ncbi:hypothetical protein JD844_010196 [Phrynosoma platyrhinos]|uniref:Probable splicing factor YJU2B n=1 Tax=Phrynosoma platyrhinos TaxID=52577 RepID=A0ABQ7TH76_PHRPL|nr:hypothetical protein JD844_010196 [Phrynosoma platyrhinos]
MHGSLNKYRNSHPLRERARKLSQGILIIRFEMPYNIWCDGCQNHIGMDKQKQKRSEIADRPWFSNTKANDTVKRLAFPGKSAAGKSPVAMSSLGVVRRKSRDKEQSSVEEESDPSDLTVQVCRQDQDRHVDGVPLDLPVGPEVDPQKAEGSPPSSLAASLVADYSDSASDSEAEL